MNSGIEHAALMISEEKTQHDSRKPQLYLYILCHDNKFTIKCRLTNYEFSSIFVFSFFVVVLNT